VDVKFLTPLAALFALAALVPLAVFLGRQRRAGAIRRMLGLAEPSRASRVPLALALAAVPGLLGLAAAQPVIEQSRSRPERTDAEAFVVLDISRSMLAAADVEAPTRLDRARRVAVRLRDELPEVPIGIVSLTDRLLPHAFPTTDRRVFVDTIEDAIGIERPGPNLFSTVATSLGALASVPKLSYFSPRARKRVLVVLTDGETLPVKQELARAFQVRPRIETVFVHLWDADERIYATGVAESGYRPMHGAGAALERVASLVGGRVFSEDEAEEVAATAREVMGEGKTRRRELEGERLALMPYVTLAAALPLGFLLLRRNI
jgi:von Willebrand factor type A domain